MTTKEAPESALQRLTEAGEIQAALERVAVLEAALRVAERATWSASEHAALYFGVTHNIAMGCHDANLVARAALAGEAKAAPRLTDAQISAYSIPTSDKRFASEIRIERLIQKQGDPLWAVRLDGDCLNKSGEWEWEPQPSSRNDAFIAQCRFASADDAINAAIEAKVRGE